MNYKDAVRVFYTKHRKDGVRAQDALRQAKWSAKYDEQTKYGRKYDVLYSRYGTYEGEQITKLPNNWKIKVCFEYDDNSGPPWFDCEGMGVIKESNNYPGEYGEYDDWILNSSHGWYRYYDWKATLPEAMKNKWNCKPYNRNSVREQAMAAMRSTCKYLHRWCNNDWWYIGMIVTLLDENDKELHEDSCWGFESDCMDYLLKEARSWAASMIRKERKTRRKAALNEKINNRFTEAMECGI